MYDVVHLDTWRCPLEFRRGVPVAKALPTLEAAKNSRKISADVVCYTETFRLVPSLEWLFDDEKANPKSYAYLGVLDAQKIGSKLARSIYRWIKE